MSKFFLFCVTFLALIASSALGQDVRYDSDTDFSKFKTYKWVTLKNAAAPIDSLTDEQIKAALDAALALKGLSKIVGDNSADMFIGCLTTEQVQEQFPGIDPDTGFRTGLAVNGNSTWTIYKGELVVNLYDVANRKLIWRGVASKNLDPKANAKKRQKNLNKAVQKLIKHYPPSRGDVPFESGLGINQVLPPDLPAFNKYIVDYPNAKLPNVENTFRWERVDFGLKPTLFIIHTLTLRGEKPDEAAYVIADKQLYSSHYFETSLDLTFLIRGSDDPKQPGFYLVRTMACEQALLTGLRARWNERYVSRSVSNLQKSLAYVKDVLEHQK